MPPTAPGGPKHEVKNMSNPAIANSIKTGHFMTNYHDVGAGDDVIMLIHGSGPGVTALANWRLIMPTLAKDYRVIAPDMVGFGYTERPEGITFNMDVWVQQAIDLMDALKIDKAHVVGNSFGGALAMSLAIKHPDRCKKLVLMGSMGIDFPITYGLDKVWGYEGTLESMRHCLDLFAYNNALITDDLAKMRFDASMEPGFHESFSVMFPFPRQNSVLMMASPEDKIKAIQHETLIVHGREDLVIPVSNAYKLFELIPNSQMHIYGKCGHWTQIEHSSEFAQLVGGFCRA